MRPESESRTAFNYKAVGRLRSSSNFQAAGTELMGISRRLENAYPEANRNKQILPQPLHQALVGNTRPTLLFLWATVGLILLIACVNVTHLQLVRSMERQRELAIRRALGSSSRQVMQPVILESLLVSLIGGAAGVLLAFPAVRVLVEMAPKDLPRTNEIHLNGWVLGFTLALSVLTALASSVLPALKAAKVDPAETLKQDASRGMTRQGATMLRDGLVVAEVAATFLLAVGAALLLHTMMALIDRDMGYQTRQLLVVDADAPAHSEQDARRAVQQFNWDLCATSGNARHKTCGGDHGAADWRVWLRWILHSDWRRAGRRQPFATRRLQRGQSGLLSGHGDSDQTRARFQPAGY